MYEIFQKLLDKHGITAYKVAKDTGITTATLTNWKKGRYVPKQDKLQKIADYFGVTVEYLMTGKMQENSGSKLTLKDERDIKSILESTEQLLQQDGLMFDGEPASQEAIDSILSAMRVGMELAKKRTKRSTLPKSTKKRDDLYGYKKTG